MKFKKISYFFSYSVQFDDGNHHITAMKSLEGEVVPLKNKVQITPDVEVIRNLS